MFTTHAAAFLRSNPVYGTKASLQTSKTCKFQSFLFDRRTTSHRDCGFLHGNVRVMARSASPASPGFPAHSSTTPPSLPGGVSR
jgi:hypothetical protein